MEQTGAVQVECLNAVLGLSDDLSSEDSVINFRQWFNLLRHWQTNEVIPSAVLSLSFYVSSLRAMDAFGCFIHPNVELVDRLLQEIVPQTLRSLASDICQGKGKAISRHLAEVGDSAFFYLSHLIGLIYQLESNSAVNSTITFLSGFDYLEYDAIGYECLLDQLQSSCKLDDPEFIEVIELSYRINSDMEMSNYVYMEQQYKDRFTRMKQVLDVAVHRIIESWVNDITIKDFSRIERCAATYDKAFTYHLSYLIEIACRTHSNWTEIVVDLVDHLRYIRQHIICYEIVFQEIANANQLTHPCLFLLSYRCKKCREIDHFGMIDSVYRDKFHSLAAELQVAVETSIRYWAKQIVERKKSYDVILLQFSHTHGNALKVHLEELIRTAYQMRPKRTDRIVRFIEKLASYGQCVLAYESLIFTMKHVNRFERIELVLKRLSDVIRSNDFSTINAAYRVKFQYLKWEIGAIHTAKRQQKKNVARSMFHS